jgi:hypothetical protein
MVICVTLNINSTKGNRVGIEKGYFFFIIFLTKTKRFEKVF